MSKWMGDAVGVGDGVLAISCIACNNSRGASNASCGPNIGSGRNAAGSWGKYLLNVVWSSSSAVLTRRSFRASARFRIGDSSGSPGSYSVSEVALISLMSGMVCGSALELSSSESCGRRFLLCLRLCLATWDGSRIILKCGVSRIWLSRMVGGPGDGGVARIWRFRMVGKPGGGGGRIPAVRIAWGKSSA